MQLGKIYPPEKQNPELAVLLNNRVLIKHHTAAETGRFYGYPATWKASTEGVLPPELYTQASKLRSAVKDKGDEGHTLPVIADSGEFAELFEMISEGTVGASRWQC